ncbi:MAG: thiamine pyrophosphate-dependent dehydrogenase E1 component subunit alpha, partial [Spirochaetaceae bacterium]|nr:thiamine pyrophosphate-dependent dehydrogenase E1 component subunit alpha [Spirochaetaceae bacterium]
MPKTQFVDPKIVRKTDVIRLGEIPVNRYKSDIQAEMEAYGAERLKRIWYDMAVIREFEGMLNSIKIQGSWGGVEYNHKGPAHLSMGQEAASVGQCVNLSVEDYIFGSHRSHGEILAKCFSAIWQMDEAELEAVMKGFLDGETLSIAERAPYAGVKDLAENFTLYGTLAEIFARQAGFTRGLGGSMHAFFTPFGSMPNNAIVGGSADIATGAALFKRINRKPGIVVSNIGDASMGCGPVWEALCLGSMDQYRSLWPKDAGGAPPILYNFFNNFYGMGGQTSGETMGYGTVARVGAAFQPDNLHAERIDGYNPLAVADAVRRKKAVLLKGDGPVLLDTMTYRISGHSPSDASSYRSPEEIKAWQEADSLEEYGAYLVKNKVAGKGELDGMREKVKEKLLAVLKLAADDGVSSRLDGGFIEKVMFSNGSVEKFDEERQPELLQKPEENLRVKAIAGKIRYGF